MAAEGPVEACELKGDGLVDKKCKPCRGGIPPLEGEALLPLKAQLSKEWELVEGSPRTDTKAKNYLRRKYQVANFRVALQFTNLVGTVAEEQKHHPDINLHSYRFVELTIYTHAIGGLIENDFILAAKCDLEFEKVKGVKDPKGNCIHHPVGV